MKRLAIAFASFLAAGFGDANDSVALSRPKPPAIRQRDWIQIPLDAFVLAKLEADGVAPPAERPREILLRRLTHSLAGRSATPAEIEAFVASRHKRAYEKEVDRLLASPGFETRFANVRRLIRETDPTTARAAADLCWRQLLGRPLEPPAALDWLAHELIDPTLVNCCELDLPLPAAWDVKHLVKAIVVSAAYRCAAE